MLVTYCREINMPTDIGSCTLLASVKTEMNISTDRLVKMDKIMVQTNKEMGVQL